MLQRSQARTPSRAGAVPRWLAVLAAILAAGYAPYASAGTLIFGFFSGYAREEGLKSGERYFLLDCARHLPRPRRIRSQCPSGAHQGFPSIGCMALLRTYSPTDAPRVWPSLVAERK